MNRPSLKSSLITLGLLVLVGTVGAETYYTYKVAERMESNQGPTLSEERAPDTAVGTRMSPLYGAWEPWTEMRQIQRQMDRAFEDSWQRMQADIGTLDPVVAAPSEPEVTLKEQNGGYVVTASLPGIEARDVNVSLDGRLLRISARSQAQEQDTADNGQVMRQETYVSNIQRAFTLPGSVDASKMHTQFDDGVLTVTIPKAAS